MFYLGLAYLLSGCLFVAPAEKGRFTESLTIVSVVMFIFVPVCDSNRLHTDYSLHSYKAEHQEGWCTERPRFKSSVKVIVYRHYHVCSLTLDL